MKRSTWITLAIFALLLAMWFMQTRPKLVETPPPLSIDGYIGNVSLEEARTLGQKQAPPYTHITLTRSDGKVGKEIIGFEKEPAAKPAEPKAVDNAPPPEAKWMAKRTVGLQITTWKAQAFRPTTMAEQLQRSIRSNFAVKIDTKTAAEYGLDPQHALDVELSGGDKPAVKLRVGLLQKAEKDGEATTWVSDPSRPDIAYQLAGRDLRTAFDFSWDDLRDRQLLTLDLDAIDRLELQRPGEKPERIVVSRPPRGSDKVPPEARAWTIVEPAGVPVGDMDEWLKAIERLSAAKFVAGSEPSVQTSGLDSPDAAILTIINGTQKTVLRFAKTEDSSGNKESWLRVMGRDEAYRIASYQRDQVVVSIDKLRERHVLSGKLTNDLRSFLIVGPASHLVANRTDGKWQVKGAEPRTDSSKMAAFLSAVDGLKVDFLPSAPTAAALENPEWTIQWTFDDGIQKVTLGKEDAEAVYGKMIGVNGTAETFKLTPWNAKQLKKQPSDFSVTSAEPAAPGDYPPPPPDLQRLAPR